MSTTFDTNATFWGLLPSAHRLVAAEKRPLAGRLPRNGSLGAAYN